MITQISGLFALRSGYLSLDLRVPPGCWPSTDMSGLAGTRQARPDELVWPGLLIKATWLQTVPRTLFSDPSLSGVREEDQQAGPLLFSSLRRPGYQTVPANPLHGSTACWRSVERTRQAGPLHYTTPRPDWRENENENELHALSARRGTRRAGERTR